MNASTASSSPADCQQCYLKSAGEQSMLETKGDCQSKFPKLRNAMLIFVDTCECLGYLKPGIFV